MVIGLRDADFGKIGVHSQAYSARFSSCDGSHVWKESGFRDLRKLKGGCIEIMKQNAC